MIAVECYDKTTTTILPLFPFLFISHIFQNLKAKLGPLIKILKNLIKTVLRY